MTAVMVFVALIALVVALALKARPTEFEQARPMEGAAMREQDGPDAEIVQFPPSRTGGAA